MIRTELDPSRTALLIMDYQVAIVGGVAAREELLQRVRQALEAARAAKLPVIYVRVGFRRGHPEIGAGNTVFGGVKEANRFAEGDPEAEIHPEVAPQAGDLVVTKRRISAFAGSDLELILRARRLDTLVLCGIATSGVVLSTVRQAADADYRLVVLADACADRDEEVHRCLIEKVFPRQAEVVPIREFVAALGGRQG